MANSKTPQAKVMDVTHPDRVRPSTTSKPVIVTNRPMIAGDPMISNLTFGSDEPSTVPSKAPSSANVSNSIITSRAEKTIQPPTSTSNDVPATSSDDLETPADIADAAENITEESTLNIADNDDGSTTSDSLGSATEGGDNSPELENSKLTASDAPVSKADQDRSDTSSVVEAEKPVEVDNVQSDDLVTNDSDSDTGKDQKSVDGDGGEQPAEEDKADKHFQSMIDQGKYFLPINQSRHRRERLILISLIGVLLLIVLMDLVLDAGILTIPYLPHTTLFSS